MNLKLSDYDETPNGRYLLTLDQLLYLLKLANASLQFHETFK